MKKRNNISKIIMGKKMWMLLSLIIVMICILVGCETSPVSDGPTSVIGTEDIDNGIEANASEANTTEEEDESIEEEFVLKEVLVGDVAPEFAAPLADGGTFTLSENSGKVILLNFWATWCGPCVGEMPAFQDLYEEYGDEVAILAVNCMEDKETIDQFIKDSGYSFPIAYDVDGIVSFTYPSSGIPYTLVIGADGIVKNIYVGAADAETQYHLYKSAIDEALAE